MSGVFLRGLLLTLACALSACGASVRTAVERGPQRRAAEVPVRGYLLHLTHYDPEWNDNGWRARPFDMSLALEVIEAMGDANMNVLVLDVEDGVTFKSHPELARPHSISLADFRRLVSAARSKNITVVPKLNFAKGDEFSHNAWMSPHDVGRDSDEYWRVAFELIDELVRETGTTTYFHVGMDEDTGRTPDEYVAAVEKLDAGLRKRGLRAVMWNDLAQVSEKAGRWRAVEARIPRSVVQVLWDYHDLQFESLAHLRRQGFEVWAAPGIDHRDQVRAWRDDVLHLGGTGLVMTQWVTCSPENRDVILRAVRDLGPLFAADPGGAAK